MKMTGMPSNCTSTSRWLMTNLKAFLWLAAAGAAMFFVFAIVVQFTPTGHDPSWGPGIRYSLWDWFFSPYCSDHACMKVVKGDCAEGDKGCQPYIDYGNHVKKGLKMVPYTPTGVFHSSDTK